MILAGEKHMTEVGKKVLRALEQLQQDYSKKLGEGGKA
ncbi:MbeD/MobD family mobilization/exclusion protein, partial [Salmonella enterica]